MKQKNSWTDVAMRYVAATLMVVAALIVAIPLDRWGAGKTPLFFVAVTMSVWFGGLGPGLFATALAGWAAAYFFPDRVTHVVYGWDDLVRTLSFLLITLLIHSLTALQRKTEADLRRSRDDLEDRVRERTAELSASNARLRESEERFRLLVEGVADYAIVMLDSTGAVVSWNPGAQRILGYAPAEILGLASERFFPPDTADGGRSALHIAEQSGRHEEEGPRVRKDGSILWANVITTALRDDAGRLRGFAQITRDVSELRGLEREVLTISEAEQRRIGHDLHDDLGQQLTGLAFLSQNLARKLASQWPPGAAEADRITALINRCVDQTRELARGFAPVELGPDGLRTALGELCDYVRGMSALAVEYTCARGAMVNDDNAALHLYRIAREAMNNAVRHSGGRKIAVALSRTDEVVLLKISDNGNGPPPDGHRGGGMGINLMKYRARAIGATLDIAAAPGGGTVVTCRCPSASREDPGIEPEIAGETAGDGAPNPIATSAT